MLPTNPLLNATAPAGPHLPVALLRQYAAGALATAAQHRVEAHTLACPRCADILAGLQQTPPATTDQALAQLQQRLRQRVQQQAAPARYDREERRNWWLIPQLAAAAALLLGLVAGGWWAWQQRHSSAQVATTAVPVVPAPVTATKPPEPPVVQAPAVASAPITEKLTTTTARTYSTHRPTASRPAQQATNQQNAVADVAVPQAEPVAPAAEPAKAASPPAPLASTSPPADSQKLAGRVAGLAVAANRAAEGYDAAPQRKAIMPAAPAIAPAPAGGYSALREKLRREATEFKPEAPDQPLSGTVQLRLTIGADGKIQQIKVIRGLREDYDEEAQRLVCDGPAWIPGISGGRRAPLDVDIAVPF